MDAINITQIERKFNSCEEYKSKLNVKKRKGDRYPLFSTQREYMPHVFTSREHTQRGRSALLKSILQSVQLNRNDSRRNCRRKQSHSDGSTKTFEFQTMNNVCNVISCAYRGRNPNHVFSPFQQNSRGCYCLVSAMYSSSSVNLTINSASSSG